MLSTQQQKVVDIHNITAKKTSSGEYVFLISGRDFTQKPSQTSEGAILRGIGYVMSRYKK